MAALKSLQSDPLLRKISVWHTGCTGGMTLLRCPQGSGWLPHFEKSSKEQEDKYEEYLASLESQEHLLSNP